MKVYAVAEQCADSYYHTYSIVGDRVYLREEDAERVLKKMRQGPWGCSEAYVCSFDLIGNPSDMSKEGKE